MFINKRYYYITKKKLIFYHKNIILHLYYQKFAHNQLFFYF